MILLIHFSLPGRAWGARKRRRVLLLRSKPGSSPCFSVLERGSYTLPTLWVETFPKCVALSLCRVKIRLIIDKTYIDAFTPPDSEAPARQGDLWLGPGDLI